MIAISFLLVAFCGVPVIKGQCDIFVNLDLDKTAPLFIDLRMRAILGPTARDGRLNFQNGESVGLACPGATNHVMFRGHNNQRIVTAKCVRGHSFTINGERQGQDITNILCKEYPVPFLNQVGNCANGQGKEIEVGFEVPGSFKNKFIEICFSESQLRTFYAVSNLEKLEFSCPNGQTSFKNDFFGAINANSMYTSASRRLPASHQGFEVQRGHLVPKCEFVDGALKRMTYYYINAAPQFKPFNEGNWRNLENTIRSYASGSTHDFFIYTGTHGTFTDSNGNLITLVAGGRMPVPSYFWKILVDGTNGKGVAFVGANDPLRAAPLCQDICPSIGWLRNFQNLRVDVSRGFVSCCTIESLRAVPNIILPSMSHYKRNSLLNS